MPNSFGRFDMVIPGVQMQTDLFVQVMAGGYVPFSASVEPNGNQMTLSLTPRP